MKIDIDIVTKEVSRFMLSLPKPYWVRVGNKGINLKADCQGCSQTQDCYSCWVYTQFDDKNRLKINITQKNNTLPHNVLWDVKRGKKKEHKWEYIETSQDADRFLRYFTGFF